MALPPSEEKSQTTEPQTPSPDHPPKGEGIVNRRNIITLILAVLLASLFLPWAGAGTEQPFTGIVFLSHPKAFLLKLLWITPICGLLALGLNAVGLSTTFIRRAAGIMPLVLFVYVFSHDGNTVWNEIPWGGWIALVSSALIIIFPDPPRIQEKQKTLTSVQLEKGTVLRHWYVPVPGFETSTADFYGAIEAELKARKVPGLEISRVEYAEGGVLSDKREYLRMIRERLVFDVCSAPFGTGHFFSCRCAEIPAIVRLWQVVLVFIGILASLAVFWKLFGFFLGGFIAIVAFVAAVFLARNAIALGLRDVDAALLKSPLIGSIYERFFRNETYYREDTRLMYCDVVNKVVEALIEDTTAAKGIKLIEINDYDPIMRDLYKPRVVTFEEEPAVKAA